MKFPLVFRHQLEKIKAKLSRKEERLADLRDQIETLKAERDKDRKKLRQGYVDLAKGIGERRRVLATALEGEGIEIGALHFPLPVSEGVVVRYVDMATREENIRRFPHLDPDAIVETTYVCDGEKLEVIAEETQDFVIANHMLEHCINPLATLRNFLRVLRPGGLLFITLPDKRFSFDVKRPVTPFSHVEKDFLQERTVEDLEVYEEWTRCVRPAQNSEELHAQQKNIHFHVWTQGEILEMFVEARRRLEFPLEIEWAAKNGGEFIVLLRKYEDAESGTEAGEEAGPLA